MAALQSHFAEVLSSCANRCITEAVEHGLCDGGNMTCFCTKGIQNDMQSCFAGACNVTDMIAAFNTTQTVCNVPVRDYAPRYLAVSIPLSVLAGIFVAIRFVYKLNIRLELRGDDYAIAVALALVVTFIALVNHGVIPYGLGKDFWTRTPEQLSSFSFFLYVSIVIYFAALTMVRHALILFYMNIFPSRSVKILLKASAVFNLCLGMTSIFCTIFQCFPVDFMWTRWTGGTKGACLNVNGIAWALSTIGIVLDGWMLTIPLWQLRQLQLHWKKKFGVAIMFCFGTLITIMSILRLRTIITFAKTLNITWTSYGIALWSTIELSVGVICTCLPTFRLVVVWFFPILSGSSGGDFYQSRSHQQPPSPSNGRSPSSSHRPEGSDITIGDVPAKDRVGLKMQVLFAKPFTGEPPGNDEISLVH